MLPDFIVGFLLISLIHHLPISSEQPCLDITLFAVYGFDNTIVPILL